MPSSSFTSVNGEGKINGTKFTQTEPLRARMPIYSSKVDVSEIMSKTKASFLYENLITNNVGPYGYWTLSADDDYPDSAWYVSCEGVVATCIDLTHAGMYGVRPVINLKI